MNTQVLPDILSQLNDTVDMDAAIDMATSDSDEDCRGDNLLASGSVASNSQLPPSGSVDPNGTAKPKKNSPLLRSYLVRKTLSGNFNFVVQRRAMCHHIS